jgi:hypothetical protein
VAKVESSRTARVRSEMIESDLHAAKSPPPARLRARALR